MDVNRFSKDKVRDGVDAQLLLDSEILEVAVNRVLTKYAELEENVLTADSQDEIREVTAKVRHYAMMRRAVMDVVDELKIIARIGRNADTGNSTD